MYHLWPQPPMKTQSLFFIFKLLPTQKEKVLFPDRTMLPLELILKKFVVKPTQHYGNLWQNDFIEMGLDLKENLDIFYQNLTPQFFGEFVFTLFEHIQTSKTNVWILVDEKMDSMEFPFGGINELQKNERFLHPLSNSFLRKKRKHV
jgi:hypothetical protein